MLSILELCKVLAQVWFATKKWDLISSMRSIVYDLSHELSNDWRLSIFEESERFGKCHNLMGTQPSAHSPFYNWVFGTSRQKLIKDRYQKFPSFSLCYKTIPLILLWKINSTLHNSASDCLFCESNGICHTKLLITSSSWISIIA